MPTKTKSLSSTVYESLKEWILSGELTTGTVVTQRDIAARLGVSRTPVRDTFFRLEQEGLMKILPGGMASVAQAPIEDIKRTFEIRGVLEGYASRQSINKMTDSIMASLHKIVDKQAEIASSPAVSEDQSKEFYRLDYQFHEIIIKTTANPRLINILMDLIALGEFQIIQSKALEVHGRLYKSVAEHKEILMLIEKGDTEGIEKALRAHANGFCNDIIDFLLK